MILADATLAASVDVGIFLGVIGAVVALCGLLWKVSQGVIMLGKMLERIEQHDKQLANHADRMVELETKLDALNANQHSIALRVAAETGDAR